MSNDLLCLEFDVTVAQANQAELSDTIRLLLFQKSPLLFEKIPYDNDRSFLELALFYLFSEKSQLNLTIEQILYGYISELERPDKFTTLSDPFGKIYLGNYGAIDAEVEYSENEILQLRGIVKKPILLTRTIQLNEHAPFMLYADRNSSAQFDESITDTLYKCEKPLRKAIAVLRKWVPEFWELIELATHEISVFNSVNTRSMGAISYHGTAFINTEGQSHDEVFYIEDLAHQCGHVIFNSLTLYTQNFLKPHKDAPLTNWTGISYDSRSIYGVFHGLFTYTTILHCLTQCILSGAFTNSQRLEALARIGFFMRKFEMDLKYMDMPEVFTPQGQRIYDGAFASFNLVKKDFEAHYKRYRYDNQPYIFNYDLFRQVNTSSYEKAINSFIS